MPTIAHLTHREHQSSFLDRRRWNRQLQAALLFGIFSVNSGLWAPPSRAQISSDATESVAPTSQVSEQTVAIPAPPEATTIAPVGGAPVELHIPSEMPSGDPINDQIWMTYYPAGSKASEQLSLSRKSTLLLPKLLHSASGTPAVVLLHYLGATTNPEMHRFARFLSGQGIAAVVVTLPYHMKRLSPDDSSLHHFVDGKVDTTVQALSQSVSDTSTVISWLERQPHIDNKRIGIIGVSLGAIVTHLVMGQDTRISAGVAMLGGGDLVKSYTESLAAKIVVRRKLPPFTKRDRERLASVDPLTYADKNQPRKVFMVQGARDVVITPKSAEELWHALGEPPIQWIDTNHLALRYSQRSAATAATEFLIQTWSGVPLNEVKLPRVKVPTVTAGLVFNLDTLVQPAVQLEVLTLGTRNHLPILHANLGVGLKGPFVGVAATVNQFVDVGVGRRFFGDEYKPYISTHFAF